MHARIATNKVNLDMDWIRANYLTFLKVIGYRQGKIALLCSLTFPAFLDGAGTVFLTGIPFPGQDQGLSILDPPFDDFAFLQAQGRRQGGGKPDVPLVRPFSLNQLNFCRISHKP